MTALINNDIASNSRSLSVAAIVVTFNRLELLKECVGALRNQTRRPDEIIVINNGSTDKTSDWLAEQTDLTVITQENLGSSGGQHTGIKAAFHQGHSWFWCMDDDTIPTREALSHLVSCPRTDDPATGFLGSLVLAVDGLLFAESYFVPSHMSEWCQSVANDHCVRVTTSTFVSLMVSRSAVAAVGLPLKEIFLIFDDTEYTRRISQKFKGYCVLDSTVVHKTPRPVLPPPTKKDFNLKQLYALRNLVYLVRSSEQGFSGKFWSILYMWYVNLREIALRKRPLRSVFWFVRGLLLRPKIEYANDGHHH